MDEKWFCRIGEREFGPLLIAQLQRLSTRGQLTAATPVRRQDSDSWITAAEVPALQSYLSGTSAPPTAVVSRVPPPPVEDQIRVPVVTPFPTAAKKDSHAGVAAVSRGKLAALLGLGGVVAILLVVILVVLLGRDGQADGQAAAVRPQKTHGTAVSPADESDTDLGPSDTGGAESLVDVWSKVTSTKVVRNARDRSSLCLVRINSIRASDDPAGDLTIAAADENDDLSDETPGDDQVLDLAALGVSSQKRVDATGKIIDPGPQPEATSEKADATQPDAAKEPGSFRYLLIEVSLANTSKDRTLEYLGWSGGDESAGTNGARLYDQDDCLCRSAPRAEAPMANVPAKVLPGETIVDVLVFELPPDGFESLRLVLPQAAFGLMGHLGFEIARHDIDG